MKNSRRDLQQLRTGRLPMIDDAALELVALSEFSRSDQIMRRRRRRRMGSKVGMIMRVMMGGVE